MAERSSEWAALEDLVARAHDRPERLEPAEIRRLGAAYRAAASDLALARRAFPDAAVTLRLRALVTAAHTLVYGRARRTETVRHFFSTTLWRCLRANRAALALSAAVLLGGVALGVLWGLADPSSAAGLLPSGFRVPPHSYRGAFAGVSLVGRSGLAVAIFTNNIEVSVLAAAGGFTFGVLTVWSLAYNGALIGVLGAIEERNGDLSQFLRLVVPHGLLELSCIVLAGGAGFVIARALIDPGRLRRGEALQRRLADLGAMTVGFMAFLVVAGTTEGIVTPWDLPLPVALAIGLGLAGTFWTLVAVGGRRRPAPAPLTAAPAPSA